MGTVSRFNAKLLELKNSINKSIQNSISTNKAVLIEQQTNGQFDKGQDSQGIQFVPQYAFSTKVAKRRKGQPTDRVTLKDTGKLYNNIEIQAQTTQAIISANVEYFKYLVTHYDKNTILGIQTEAMKDFLKEFTLPEIEKNFKTIIRQ